MASVMNYLREFNMLSVFFRLFLSVLLGGAIGLERGRKGRAAGFRTYMLTCLGAAVTMLLGQYNDEMRTTVWSTISAAPITADVSRFGAQVINGIGFLGAGTILVTKKQEVLGLTTASALWASACMGLAIGAGFYECVVLAFALILLCVQFFPKLDAAITRNAKNINLYIEFSAFDELAMILMSIKQMNIKIYEIDLTHGDETCAISPSATIYMRRPSGLRHEHLISELSGLESVVSVREI